MCVIIRSPLVGWGGDDRLIHRVHLNITHNLLYNANNNNNNNILKYIRFF